MSGRPIIDLLNFFKGIGNDINLIGSHGAEIKYKGEKPYILESVKKIIKKLRKIRDEIELILKDFPCFYIEDKKVSFAIHYRNCPKEYLGNLAKIRNAIREYEKKLPINIIEGKKVIEVKPANIDKGRAVNGFKDKYGLSNEITICIGDDVTDEHMFESNKEGLNIKVINKNIKTNASYYIKNVAEVQKFLEGINQAFQ